MRAPFAPLFTLLFLLVLTGSFAQEAFPQKAILNAAYMGDTGLVERILATSPDINARDALGGTALHVAVFQTNLDIIRLLLNHGFDVNAVASSSGFTPLHYCVWANNAPAARLLILNNADRQIRANDGLTPLEKAAKEGKRELILELSRR